MSPPLQISTPRLTLRPLGTEFLDSAHQYSSDAENTKYMVFLPNESISETKAFLLACEHEWAKSTPAFYEFAILKDGVHIGAVGIYTNERKDTAELGWILNPSYHNRGYATEAARAVMDFAKTELNIRRFVAHCDTENAASRKVMEKLGFVRTSETGGRKNKGSDKERREYTYELSCPCENSAT